MENVIEIYTDGACSGNPGPAGSGVVLLGKDTHMKVLHGLGEATNNIAELTAVKIALEYIADKHISVVIYTDSKYVIGVISEGWKAKKNVDLINEIKDLMVSFSKIEFRWVKAHNGNKWNEVVDKLSRDAIKLPEGVTNSSGVLFLKK